jgi:hypothetical protein
LQIPLKTSNRQFNLYKIVTLPIRLSNHSFIHYIPEFSYFGIDTVQHNYILFSESEYRSCSTHVISVCPASNVIFNTQLTTCESSLFFQTADSIPLCQRKLLIHHHTPILQCHDSVWFYHFPEPQPVTLHCRRNDSEVSTTRILSENGIIHNSSPCLLTTKGIQTILETSGNTEMNFAVQEIFTPILHDIATSQELQMLHNTVPSEITQIDDLVTHARSHRQSTDLSTLVHATNTMKYHEEKSYWHFPTLFILCLSAVTLFLTYILKSYWTKLIPIRFTRRNALPSTTSPPDAVQDSPSTSNNTNATDDSRQDCVTTFAAYPLRLTS